ncbi:MAG: hypothetical protein ACLPKE_31020 [Streptosporangiaceae bacterium]
MGQWLARWRTWDQRLLWLGAVDVLAALIVTNDLLTRHHSPARISGTVAVAVAVMLAITVPEIVRMRRLRHAATRGSGPSAGTASASLNGSRPHPGHLGK